MHPLLTQWETWQRAGRRSERTITERSRVIAAHITETGTDPCHTTGMDIAEFLAAHPEWSASTAATYHSYLMSWYKFLVLMGHRQINPMFQVQAPRRPERSPRPVADAELLRLLSIRTNRRTRVMILLAALAGLRVAEIANVRGEDLDLDAARIRVLGKGNRTCWVPLHPLLIEAAETMPRQGVWFPGNSRRRGEPIRSKSVSDIIGNAMRRAGVAGTPHALRHWYATSLLTGGADLRTVQELMRHKSVQTTQVYTQVPDARRSAAVNRLDPFRAA